MITFIATLLAHTFGKRRVEDHIWVISMVCSFCEVLFSIAAIVVIFGK